MGRVAKIRRDGPHYQNGTPQRPAEVPSSDVDTERFVLGSVLLDDKAFATVLTTLTTSDFILDSHRHIIRAMSVLYGQGSRINYATLADQLRQSSHLETVGGLSYLVSLDDHLPRLPSIESYVGILKRKAAHRKLLAISENLAARVASGEEPGQISVYVGSLLADVGNSASTKAMSVNDVPLMSTFGDLKLEWVVDTILVAGTVTMITGDSGSGKSSLVSALCYAISAGESFAGLRTQQRPVLYLDRENPYPLVAERFARMGISDSPDFRYWGSWCQSEPPAPNSSAITQWVKSCEVMPVVVVDSVGAFSDGADENDAAQVRQFMDAGPRRLAHLGATVIVVHNSSNKTDTARFFRGSSAFMDTIDVGYLVNNLSVDVSRLGPLRLRPWKVRAAVPEMILDVVDGRIVQDKRTHAPERTAADQLASLLRMNPCVTSTRFETLAGAAGLGRNAAREFLDNGVLNGFVSRKSGANRAQRHTLIESAGDHYE